MKKFRCSHVYNSLNKIPDILAAVFAGVAVLLGALNHAKVQAVHVMMNSRMDQLVNASKDTGRVEERAAQDTAAGRTSPPPPPL